MSVPVVYILRGLPGSGKSTLAHQLADVVIESDDYFTDASGEYHGGGYRSFRQYQSATRWSHAQLAQAMACGHNPIAVANCHITHSSMQPVLDLATRYGYAPFVVVCSNNFGSVHGVPPSKLEQMRRAWEH